jgi:ribosomal protein L37AE/L43A
VLSLHDRHFTGCLSRALFPIAQDWIHAGRRSVVQDDRSPRLCTLEQRPRQESARMRNMHDPRSAQAVTRPVVCPYCDGKIIDTLAKVISAATLWRCRSCDRTWTIASLPAMPAPPRRFS